MALSGTDRGTGTHNTSATTFTLSPASNFTNAGPLSMAALCISADNAHSGGTAFTTFTVTDSLGNTWTRRTSPLYDPGSASAGVEGAIFTTPQNGGKLTTGTTITVTFDTATTAKVWTLMEVAAATGFHPEYQAQGVGTGAATAAPTVTTASLTNGDMVIGMLCNEYGTAQTPTGDADTTNGSWSTMQTNEIGTTTSGQTIITQRKVVTATATQTFNPTLGTSSDCIPAWISLREIADVGTLAVTLATIAISAAAVLAGPVATLAATLGALTLSGAGVGPPPNLVQQSGIKQYTGTATSRTENAAANFTVGNLVIVGIAYYEDGTGAPTAVSIAGTTATQVAPAKGAFHSQGSLWYAFVVNSGRTDVVLTLPATTHQYTLGIDEWSGLSAVDKTGTQADTFGTSTSATTGTLAQNAELVYFQTAISPSANQTIGTPTNYTVSWTQGTDGTYPMGAMFYRSVTDGATQTPSSSNSAGAYTDGAIASFKVGAASATGTLASTLGALTLSGAGVLSGPVGTATPTLGALTLTGAATVPVVGTLSSTLGILTISGTGTVASASATGNLASTLGALTLSGAGAVDVKGLTTSTLGALALTGAATVGPPVGTGSLTLGAATLSGTGSIQSLGTLSAGLAPLALSGAGVVPINGTESTTLGALTLASSGQLSGPLGTATPTLGAATLSGTATLGPPFGTAAVTLATLTLTASGTVPSAGANGTLAATLGTLVVSGSGGVPVQASSSPTLGVLTLSGAGTQSAIQGSASSTLGSLTLSGAGTAGFGVANGTLSVTLATLSSTASASVPVQGSCAVSLAQISLYSTSSVPVQGAASLNLGAVTLSASGAPPVDAPCIHITALDSPSASLALASPACGLAITSPAALLSMAFPGSSLAVSTPTVTVTMREC